MAHVYNVNKDPELDKKMDEWIEIIGMARNLTDTFQPISVMINRNVFIR